MGDDAVSSEVVEQVLEVGGGRVRGVHDQVRESSEGAVDFKLGWVHEQRRRLRRGHASST